MKEVIVQIQNKDVLLAGTLYIPDRPDRVPLIIATHPSGEGLGESDIFRHLR